MKRMEDIELNLVFSSLFRSAEGDVFEDVRDAGRVLRHRLEVDRERVRLVARVRKVDLNTNGHFHFYFN